MNLFRSSFSFIESINVKFCEICSTCDLVMLLNSRFDAAGEDERKFAGFVVGLLK